MFGYVVYIVKFHALSCPCSILKDVADLSLSFQGFVHLALQSRLPIVPMVLTGTHLAWRKGSLHIRPAPLAVKFLAPISTTGWTADKINDHVQMVHDIFVKNLPESQRPLVVEGARNTSSS